MAPGASGRRLAAILTLGFVLLALDSLGYAAGRLLILRGLMYRPPVVPEGRPLSYANYLEKRHPVLGWPYPVQLAGRGDRFDAAGARPSPGFPAAEHVTRVSLYGDSFTQSPQEDADTWAEELARLLDRRVANYGMSSYGSDQALLRYELHAGDEAAVVVLGHFTEDLLRNLTRLRDLQNYEAWYGFKPRFVLGADGALEHVPLPRLSEAEYRRLTGWESPPLELEHESFQPGGAAGATLLAFPFSVAVVRNLGDFRMRAALRRQPVHAEFYRPGHALRGLELTLAILRAFADEAERRGQRPLALVLPGEADLDSFRRTGEWVHAPLVVEAQRAGIACLDFAPSLAAFARGRAPEELFHKRGHYTAAVDRELARSVYEEFARRGWLEPIRARGARTP